MCRQSCNFNPNLIFLLAEVSNKVQLITLDRPASPDSLLEMPYLLGYAQRVSEIRQGTKTRFLATAFASRRSAWTSQQAAAQFSQGILHGYEQWPCLHDHPSTTPLLNNGASLVLYHWLDSNGEAQPTRSRCDPIRSAIPPPFYSYHYVHGVRHDFATQNIKTLKKLKSEMLIC